MLYTQNHCNITFTNNKFIDARWLNSGISISVEHVAFKCPIPPFTKITISNNVFLNSVSRITYIYFTMNFNDDGIQEVEINNNTFDNIQIFSPGLFKLTKTKRVNWTVSFSDNHFRRIKNVLEGTSVVEFVSSP